MKVPDKKMHHTESKRLFHIHLFSDENAAYLYEDGAMDTPLFKFGPINQLSTLEINVQMRKAARYVIRAEDSYQKLVEAGFDFVKQPIPFISRKAKPAVKRKTVDKDVPKWLSV